jgi:hypothetical protein
MCFLFVAAIILWDIWTIVCMLVNNHLFLVSGLDCLQAAGLLKLDDYAVCNGEY